MADVYSKKKRSQIMSRIRSTGTKPETMLYAVVREILGTRRKIEVNLQNLPGQPDIVVPSLRLALFADGCFYHACPKHGHNPKSNLKYWLPKLIRNKKRDKRNRDGLRRMGLAVWAIWEHALKGSHLSQTKEILRRRLQKRANALRQKL